MVQRADDGERPRPSRATQRGVGVVSLVRVTPDNQTAVYTADEITTGKLELFSVAIGGGARTKLNASMAGNGVTEIRVGSDGVWVAYRADQVTAGVTELFSARVGVAASSERINGTPLSGSQDVAALAISPDALTVVYEADETLAGTIDLLKASIDGVGTSSALHTLPPPEDAGFFAELGLPLFGPRVVYPVIAAQTKLFSVPSAGTPTLAQVNGPLASGDSVLNAFVPSAKFAGRLMAWGIGLGGSTVTRRLFVGPMRPDLTPEQINVTAGSGATGVKGYEITADEDYGVYLQDQTTNGKTELFASALDSDGDGVPNPSDNCNFIANAAQNVFTFGQTIRAANKTTFEWNATTDARFVRGPLSGVANYTQNASGLVMEARSYTDASVPVAAGSGFWYLFTVNCSPGGSYQTTLGAEPARDTALVP